MGQCLCPTESSVTDDGAAASSIVGTSKRRALLVGINYVGSNNELRGCVNDVRTQKQSLMRHYGFQEREIRILTEDQPKDLWPNKANIEAGLRWLYTGAAAGDLLFFAYSGHGSQVRGPSGVAQCICPVDCLEKPWPGSVMLDTEIHQLFFEPLPVGCKAIAIFDCCHSGTVANLGVTRDISPSTGGVRYMAPPAELQVAPADEQRTLSGVHRMVNSGKVSKDHQLWVLSGCQDSQTSADAYCDGMYQGAFTWGMERALAADGWHLKYSELLDEIRKALKGGGYEQMPELSTTHAGYLDDWFMDVPK